MRHFWPSVASVLTGTAVAQAIPLLGSLVLARQYAPAEFGIFAAWLGVVMLLAVVFTGRFETALAVEDDGEPRRAAVMATMATIVIAACAVGVSIGVATVLRPDWVVDTPAVLIVACVPTAFAVAATQTWQSWAAAEGSYRQLSVMRISQTAAVTSLQIAAGIVHSTASALAIAQLLGVLVSLAVSVLLMPIGVFAAGRCTTTIGEFWRRQRRFPLLSLPADAINTAAAQLPVLMVADRFGADIAGLLAMTIRVLGAPIGLLGRSVLDVFKRHAASSFRERGECHSEYMRTFKVLGVASVGFVFVMAITSEPLFVVAFGERWRGSGVIAVWLLPLFALRFMASPLSYMTYIAGKQHVDLVWQFALLGMTVATLNVPQRYDVALQAYSAGYSLLYIVYLALSYRFSLGEKR